jgi:hypothetical protein
MNKTNKETVGKLLETISKAGLKEDDLISVLSLFLLSIGASLEGCEEVASEEVVLAYAKNPTLGNALMAQAIFMEETWHRTESTDSSAKER